MPGRGPHARAGALCQTGARRLAIRMRGLSARSRETLALDAPFPSEAVRQTIPARIQKCEKQVVRPGIAAGAPVLISSIISSGPKILAVKLPRERLHVCMAVRAARPGALDRDFAEQRVDTNIRTGGLSCGCAVLKRRTDAKSSRNWGRLTWSSSRNWGRLTWCTSNHLETGVG